jgi:predicted nucleic acid-binding protein
MSFLLDTNVLSEPMRERPNSGVLAWLSRVNEDRVFVSVVTITELRYGVERLATGKRRERLDGWLRKDLISRFEGRILPVDLRIGDACGRLMARSESTGRPIEALRCFHRGYCRSSWTHSRHAEYVGFRAHPKSDYQPLDLTAD